jgi:photosystem II stability/assembly factor-like uncharacterized protein
VIGPALLAVLFVLQAPPLAPRKPRELPDLAGAFDPMTSQPMQGDAQLTDVCFVDPQHGWAVGDRGTILHTDDGGRHWHLQRSGVACRLESVCFLDSQHGWAAGGYSHPYTHTSTGVLLATRDGGRNWHHNTQLLLPALRRIRFFDRQHGWAIGCRSAMFPSGGFVTDDGGRSFRPLSGEKTAGWLAADFLDLNTGALAGRRGSVAMVRRGRVQPAPFGELGLRNLRQLKLAAPVRGWLVGDGGLVMTTGDLGASWQTPPGGLPQEMARQFDFAALAVRGPKCWVAGSPGTRVFHSPDAGRTWSSVATGAQVPIHALCFVDDEHGWAVGALGTILATDDGGRSWRRQRAGGTRAALLGIFSGGRDVPLELFARLSGNEGYLGVVELLSRRDVELPERDEVHPADRASEALVAVGASGAGTTWRFPLRQPGLELGAEQIIAGWDRANDSRGLAEAEAHVVRQIRLWRPAVIVTHDASPQGDQPLGHLINQLVLRAVERAGDPTCLPQQITDAGLQPWEVKKVYAYLPPPARGSTELPTAQWAARLGRSLADVAAMPRGLVEDRFSVPPPTLGFRLLVSNLPQDQDRRDFFSGIVLYPGGEARRELVEPPAGGLDLLRRTAQRRRNMQAIIERSKERPHGGSHLLAETGELTRDLDAGSAGRILYHLGQQYHQGGRWSMAAETFELLCDRYGDHPLVRPALLWLVQYYASGEAAWRQQGGRRIVVRQASALSTDLAEQEDRPGRAAELGRRIERTRPDLFAQPALRFPLAVAHRHQGFPRQAEHYYLTHTRGARRDPWWACARGEEWLSEPKGLPPKSVLHCVRALSKPRLDGRLDDAVWQRAKPAELKSTQHDDDRWPGAVILAYDDEFLYLAINCRQAPGAKYEKTEGPRPRDPDLSSHDRVEVFLDLDRDFSTYYRLSIDHRGWPSEGCWGDRSWNPTWFVAARSAEGTWTAEAAIPLDQLTGRYPGPREVWALGIQRTVPGVGFQSWSEPAAAAVMPEGFGYLIFD